MLELLYCSFRLSIPGSRPLNNCDMDMKDIVMQMAHKAFDVEFERTKYIFSKAEKFMAGVVAIIGYHLIDIEKFINSDYIIIKIASWSALAFLITALLLALMAMQARKYKSFPAGRSLYEMTKDKEIPNEDVASEMIIVLLLDMREDNARINDQLSNLILWSGIFLVVGFMLVVVSRLSVFII